MIKTIRGIFKASPRDNIGRDAGTSVVTRRDDKAYVLFSSDRTQREKWAQWLDLPTDHHAENNTEARWALSMVWIEDIRDALVQRYTWTLSEETDKLWLLSLIEPPSSASRYIIGLILGLPTRFSDFFEPALCAVWGLNFTAGIFKAERVRDDGKCDPILMEGLPEPLVDLWNLLQCLAPGMLVVACASGDDESLYEDDGSERAHTKYERGLPPLAWIEAKEENLRLSLGNELYEKLAAKAGGESSAAVACWL